MNELVKKLILSVMLPVLAILVPLQADAQWEEKIYTDKAYSVKRVDYSVSATYTAPMAGTTDYLVKDGDTLIDICRRHKITLGQLLEVNNISNPDLVMVGQTLAIPVAAEAMAKPDSNTVHNPIPAPAMAWPVDGEISSHFGIRDGRPHHGLDIAAPHGAVIKAPRSGYVTLATYYGTYGNTIIIDHGDGIRSLYAHCSILLVSEGQYVQAGQAIARVGNTGRSFGPHLHWEVSYKGTPFDPLLCMLNTATKGNG